MKTFHLQIQLIILIAIIPLNALIAADTAQKSIETTLKIQSVEPTLKIESEIKYRWENAKKIKKTFSPYSKKSNKEIHKEFSQLKKLRKKLWFSNPKKSHPEQNSDYLAKHKGSSSELLAFNYNCIDRLYNASEILLYGHHFIALKEPRHKSLKAFFNLLTNNKVALLVRLNPEKEYNRRHKYGYWKNLLYEEDLYDWVIEPKTFPAKKSNIPATPYFYTDLWKDNKGVAVEELYRLVQEVREIYSRIQDKGPIACHCAAGIGRTGTFIAAYVLANMLDLLDPEEISIEALVLNLSLQRPNMVSVNKQYLLLYRFVEYYLKQKHTINTENIALQDPIENHWLQKSDFLVLGKQ